MSIDKRQSYIKFLFWRAWMLYRTGGIALLSERVWAKLRRRWLRSASANTIQETQPNHGEHYRLWREKYGQPTGEELEGIAQQLAKLEHRPVISVIMATWRSNPAHLAEAIESVLAQRYPHWQLCIADDGSQDESLRKLLERYGKQDERVRVIFRPTNGGIAAATNEALSLASGEWVAFLDHDDLLHPLALALVALYLDRHPAVRLLYTDEDKIDEQGRYYEPNFKPDWNPFLLLSQNYICHLLVIERALLESLGGMREDFDGAQDYDLVLRATERLQTSEIGHIPHVLYHWRSGAGSTARAVGEKPTAWLAGQRALTQALQRRSIQGTVEAAPEVPIFYRIRWAIPDPPPKVSIIIPTRNGDQLLRRCLDSLFRLTGYPNYEVLIIDNGSDQSETLDYLQRLVGEGRIRVLRRDEPFNYSRLNNAAVQEANGEFIVLMNDDIEIITPDWLSEMLGPALLPEVGCVGARLWYPDGRLQHAGVIMVCGVAGHAHKHLPRGKVGFMGRAAVMQAFSAVTAACLLVRKTLFEQAGGLDETLAVAFNDVDFCLRVGRQGYWNVWTPYAEMVHHESASRGYEDSMEKQQRFAREVEFMQKRWGALLSRDPAYSPNLTMAREDFSLGEHRCSWPNF